MTEPRIPPGTKGLNEVVSGGSLPSSSYVVIGGPGTGKTVLALQFIHENAGRAASCLHITFAESERPLRRNAAVFRYELSGVTIADYSQLADWSAPADEYMVFPPAGAEEKPVWTRLHELVVDRRSERLVIDSASYLRCLSSAVEIDRLRGSAFLSGLHPPRITSHGINVSHHRIEAITNSPYTGRILPFGVPSLDKLLRGKSRGFMYTSTESSNSIRHRAQAVGIALKDRLANSGIRHQRNQPTAALYALIFGVDQHRYSRK